MAQKQQWILLDDCINNYLSESEQSISKYFKCFNLAFRAMDELGLDFFYQISTFALPINANQTVNIPSNVLRYTKVGVLNPQGEIVSLLRDDNITTYADLLPTRISTINSLAPADTLGSLNVSPFAYNNYWNGNSFCTLYGLPSGGPFIGSFKYDESNSVIVLNINFAFDYLILEAVVSPKEGEEYYVPVQFKEAIISYLSWKDIKSMPASRKGSIVDKRDRKHDYYNERRLAIARYNPFRPEEAHQLNMLNTRMTVKI